MRNENNGGIADGCLTFALGASAFAKASVAAETSSVARAMADRTAEEKAHRTAGRPSRRGAVGALARFTQGLMGPKGPQGPKGVPFAEASALAKARGDGATRRRGKLGKAAARRGCRLSLRRGCVLGLDKKV